MIVVTIRGKFQWWAYSEGYTRVAEGTKPTLALAKAELVKAVKRKARS